MSMLEHWQQITGISYWSALGLAVMGGLVVGVWRFAMTAPVDSE
jgi:hypothetical protein